MTRERVAIFLLSAALLLCARALIVTENQRYAMLVGLCSDPTVPKAPCLASTETRTGWWWHLYYGLRN